MLFEKKFVTCCWFDKLWKTFTCLIVQGKQGISLEPGGQFELSGAPVETLHQTYSEVNSHLYQVSDIFLF